MASLNFSGLLHLVNIAEKKLIEAGTTDPLLRITTLRGIYYGTKWSKDFQTEKSESRNWAFWAFTGGQDPPDPRHILGPELFKKLQVNQDIIDKEHKLDFGHILIGLDARKSSIARSTIIPAMGGTGLEISTWLGDLGGGAAFLAFQRLKGSRDNSLGRVFINNSSDYGASINLEGDVAGYLVASEADEVPSEPKFDKGVFIADALKEYLPIGASSTKWQSRASRFATAIGGKINNDRLIGQEEFAIELAQKIEDWGAWYSSHRYILSGQIQSPKIGKYCAFLSRTSKEVASTFVNALDYSIRNPDAPIMGRPPFPNAAFPKKDCSNALLKAAATSKQTESFFDELSKQSRAALKQFLDF